MQLDQMSKEFSTAEDPTNMSLTQVALATGGDCMFHMLSCVYLHCIYAQNNHLRGTH